MQNDKYFHTSVNFFPTSNEPIQVIVDFYPFDQIQDIYKLDSNLKKIEECPGCKHFVDSNFTRGEDKRSYKCPYCKALTIKNQSTDSQVTHNIFRFSKKPKRDFKFNLVFALDACVNFSEFKILKKSFFIALDALPDNEPFMVAIIYPKFFEFIFVKKGFIIRVSSNDNSPITTKVNISEFSNKNHSKPTLKKYLSAIEYDECRSPKFTIDNFFRQFSNDEKGPNLFRIILFSPRYPTMRITRDIIIDLVSPTKIVDPRLPLIISGYYLCLSENEIQKTITSSLTVETNQVENLIKYILSSPQIFNVKIEAESHNYYCKEKNFAYGTATKNFCQSFLLSPKRFNSTSNPAIFTIKMKYLKMKKSFKFTRETIYATKQFPKSDDFLMIASSINPFVVIPHKTKSQLTEFTKNLFDKYRKISFDDSNKETDYSFSIIPNCQWFLRALFSDKFKIENDFIKTFCSYDNRFNKFYPNVSFWDDPNQCFAERCTFEKMFYELAGCPKIVMVDSIYKIEVYTEGNIKLDNTEIEKAYKKAMKRFPKPDLFVNLPLENFVEKLTENIAKASETFFLQKEAQEK